MNEYRLVSLELYRFVGMELTGIKRFKLVPRKDKMVILGRNGCGKSRLLSVLLPHALNKTDLMDGGYYKQVADVNGVLYTFHQYRHGKGIRCDIYCGDTALVTGANPTVYNDKVKEILGYDKKTKELLSGEVSLTRLSTPERKYWFSQLATSDLTTALKYFKLLKENLRDTVGAIKVTERYVSDLKPMVMESDEEFKSLNERIHNLEEDYHVVSNEWMNYNRQSEFNLEEIFKECDKWAKLVQGLSLEDLEGADYYIQLNAELKAEHTHLKMVLLPKYNKEINETEQSLSEAKFYAKDEDKLKARMDVIEKSMAEMADTDNLFAEDLRDLTTDTLEATLNSLDSAEMRLNEEVTRQISSDKLVVLNDKSDKLKAEHQTLLVECNKIDSFTNDVDQQVKRHNHTEDETCPACKHEFKPGFNGVDIKTLQERANVARSKRVGIEEKLTKLGEDITFYRDAIARTSELMEVVQSLYSKAGLRPVITAMLDDGGINQHTVPHKWFTEFRDGLNHTVRLRHLKEEHDKLAKAHMIALAASGKDVCAIERHLNDLIEKSTSVSGKITTLSDQMVEVTKKYNQAIDADVAQVKLDGLMAVMEKAGEEQTAVFYTEYLSGIKDRLWGLLNSVKSRLQTLEESRKELAYNEEKLTGLRNRRTTYNNLVKEMSPTDGILAEYLYKSIFSITDSMSYYIENIFEYTLVVKPCDVDDGELDYTFPVVEGESGVTRVDVRQGSAAQQEIFNSTFVMSAGKALGLSNHPVLLDEPGAALDPGHKERYADFLAEYFESDICSQAFVISHNSEIYSRFGNIDYIVINPDGIHLPDSYNECVEIEYESVDDV